MQDGTDAARAERSPRAALALMHLAIVFAAAAHLDLAARMAAGARALFELYGALSGANTGYAFFAPGVGTQARVRFEIRKGDGRVIEEPLAAPRSPEARLRLGNIVGFLFRNIDDTALRRAVAASWAAKVLSRHPDARSVSVVTEIYDLPDMARYRSGERPRWKPLVTLRFEGPAGRAAPPSLAGTAAAR